MKKETIKRRKRIVPAVLQHAQSLRQDKRITSNSDAGASIHPPLDLNGESSQSLPLPSIDNSNDGAVNPEEGSDCKGARQRDSQPQRSLVVDFTGYTTTSLKEPDEQRRLLEEGSLPSVNSDASHIILQPSSSHRQSPSSTIAAAGTGDHQPSPLPSTTNHKQLCSAGLQGITENQVLAEEEQEKAGNASTSERQLPSITSILNPPLASSCSCGVDNNARIEPSSLPSMSQKHAFLSDNEALRPEQDDAASSSSSSSFSPSPSSSPPPPRRPQQRGVRSNSSLIEIRRTELKQEIELMRKDLAAKERQVAELDRR